MRCHPFLRLLLLPPLLLCDRLAVHLAAGDCFRLHQITIHGASSSSTACCRARRASPLFREAGACSQFGHMSRCHVISMGMAWYRMAETLPVDSAARMQETVRYCTQLYRPHRI